MAYKVLTDKSADEIPANQNTGIIFQDHREKIENMLNHYEGQGWVLDHVVPSGVGNFYIMHRNS